MKETEQEVLNHIPDPLGKPVWENRTAEEQNNWQNLPNGEVQTCSPQCR